MQEWNAELAEVAQNYTDLCIFSIRNPNRVSQQTTFSSVGENFAVVDSIFSATLNYTDLVKGWYDENQDYNFQANNCSSTCESYTQVRAYTCNRKCMHMYTTYLVMHASTGSVG